MNFVSRRGFEKSVFPLAVIPVLVPVVTLTFVHLFGPYEGDPSYGPLMSGLNLLHFERPGYLDHPGTPIHILTAAVLGLMWLLRAPFVGFHPPDFDILPHSDLYLYVTNIVIALLIAGANYYLGRQLLIATGRRAVAMLGQLTVFMAFPYLLTLPLVTPDSLIIFSTTLFVALLVPLVFSAQEFRPDRRYCLLLGAVFGLCIATKITCGPLCFLLLLLRDRTALLYVVGASVVAFFILILPAITLLPGMIKYFFYFFTHNGGAGSGAAGVPPAGVLLANFRTLLVPGAGLLATLAICGGLLVFRAATTRTNDGFNRLFLLSACTILVQFALVVRNPGDRYLEPAYAVTALVYPAMLYLALSQPSLRRQVACAAISVVLTLIGAHAIRTTTLWLADAYAAARDDKALLEQADASGCTIIPYYDAPTLKYRLVFGNGTSGLRHSEALSKLYPDFISYNNGRHRFETFTDVLEPEPALKILHAQKCIYLLGSALERFAGEFWISPERMIPVARTYHGRANSTGLYKLQISPETTWKDVVFKENPPPE
jgi:hypothetical protein